MITQQRTWLEIDRSALFHNIEQLARISYPAQFGVVVKGNAYGHGLVPIAKLCEEHVQVRWIFVAGTSEAVMLRKQGIQKPILALTYVDTDPEVAILHHVDMVVYDFEGLEQIAAAAYRLAQTASVHIKIDTNMSRLGVKPDQLDAFVKQARSFSCIKVAGIFTHLADTSNTDLSFSYEQLRIFDQAEKSLPSSVARHVLASGSLMFDRKYNIVRVGTNLFGFWKSAVQKNRFATYFPKLSLKQVLTWKTTIIQIKYIEAGASVGYNQAFKAPYTMRIAIIPVGYVDGYARSLSQKGFVGVGGTLARVIGMVSMNLTIIDVSDIQNLRIGDEVVLIGQQAGLTATEQAMRIDTINNELISRINEQLPRIIV